MAAFLAPLAFSGLIAAQFLAIVVAVQYRAGFTASPDISPLATTLIHRAA